MQKANITFIIILITAVFHTACDPDLNSLDCDTCVEYIPEEGKVLVDFTINEENPEVIYHVYLGDEVGEDTLFTDTARTTTETLFLETELHYSFEAIYQDGSKAIHAFDGGETKVAEIECDEEPCYYARVLSVDLRLLND